MKIEDYLSLYSSYIGTLVDTNPTDFTTPSLKEAIIAAVNILKPLRLDDYSTNKTLTSLLNKYRKAIKTPDGEIDHYENTVDSNLLSHLLLKYFKREKSYYHAYLRLQQEENCRTSFPIDIIFMNEQEIEDAVIADIESVKHREQQKETVFIDLLISGNKESLLNLLHALLDTTNNKKDFAIAVLALEELGLLGKYGTKKNLYKTLQPEFGDIGTDANFNHYLNPNNRKMILDAEIESFSTSIKNLLGKTS